MIEIKKENNTNEYRIIEKLATEILHEVHDPIIPAEHTKYFYRNFNWKMRLEIKLRMNILVIFS